MDRGSTNSESTLLRRRPPSISTRGAAAAAAEREWKGGEEPAAAMEAAAEEPVSPAARLFREPHFNCYIVAAIGSAAPMDLAAARGGLEDTIARHPRFCSVQVADDAKNGNKLRWVRTKVNVQDHIVVPDLDPTAMSNNPDQLLEDYVSSLSTLPMDHSRPLWEFHVLDFPTSEAAATVVLRMHHSLGDGTSLLSLLIACTRSAADPAALPALPPPPTGRSGPIYARPRPPLSAGLLAFAMWILSYIALAWHTVVDVACFVATALFLKDADTLFKAAKGVEFRRKRFVNRTLSLDDVKYIKNAMSCTVNDVLISVTSAALSRYYFRKSGDTNSEKKRSQKNIQVRSTLLVNIRPTPGLHTLAKMMESGKDNSAKWGNLLGYMILPFSIAMHDDPLEYVRKGKKIAARKKSSLEAIFTYMSADMIVKLFGIKAAAALCYGMFSHTTLSFSNMIGPVEQAVFFGHPIVYIAPSVYGHPHALTVHYQSYMNSIKLVLAVDETQFPDSHQLLDDFSESLRLIRDAALAKS